MKERSNINDFLFENLDDMQASWKAGDRPVSRILQEILNHVTEIVRSEVRLAGAEVRQDATKVAKAGMLVGIGTVCALYALGFVLLSAVYALGTGIPLWLSALIVGAGTGITAAIFLQVGRNRMKQASLKPDQTIRSLQENVTWLKKRTK